MELKKYRVIKADQRACGRAKRHKMSYLAKNNLLRNLIKQKVLGKWSSE